MTADAASTTVHRSPSRLFRPPLSSGARVAHLATLVVAFPLLLFVTRQQWFFIDEWAFLTRGLPGHHLDLFTAYGGHWSTIPILIYRALFAVFGVRTYEPYISVLLLAHIAVAHLLWRVMLRTGVQPWVATASSGLFLVLGAGYENIILAFAIGFVGALACGLAAVLVVDQNRLGSLRATWLSWALLTASLMFSGVGVVMVVVASLTALFGRRDLRAALTTLLVPILVFLVWFIAAGHQNLGAPKVATLQTLEALPGFVWLGLTAAMDGVAPGVAGFGVVVVVGLAGWLVTKRQETSSHAIAYAAALGVIVYYALVGFGRAASIPGEAVAPRHVYDAVALALPALAWGVSELARRDIVAQVAVVGAVAFCGCLGLSQLLAHANTGLNNGFGSTTGAQTKGQVLAAAALLEQGMRPIASQPDPNSAPALTVADLQAMARDGDLPPITGLTPTDLYSARAALETSVTASPLFTAGTARLVSVQGALVASDAGDCVDLQSALGGPLAFRLAITGPASLSLQSPADTRLRYYLQSGSAGGVSANVVPLYLSAGQTAFLNVAIDQATPYIVSPGPVEVCGAPVTSP